MTPCAPPNLPLHATGSMHAEDVPKLPYLTACINETMRLYPAATDLARVSTQDHVLGGYHVPQGKLLLTGIYSLHRWVGGQMHYNTSGAGEGGGVLYVEGHRCFFGHMYKCTTTPAAKAEHMQIAMQEQCGDSQYNTPLLDMWFIICGTSAVICRWHLECKIWGWLLCLR